MIFNSYQFLFLFLPVFLSIFYFLIWKNKTNLAILFLGTSSLAFYSIEGFQFLPILLLSIAVNYLLGRLINSDNHKHNKLCLILGISFNLGLLIYFKYTNFLMNNVLHLPTASIILPIGISFYTFTQIAYLADCYQNKAGRYTFSEYLSFVTFFPHLIAGPILIHHHFIPQLRSRHFGKPREIRIYAGLIFFSIGMFKKVIIADSIAPYVHTLFELSNPTILEAWSAALLYTIQLYYDFSAYSEMAIGLALLLNLRIPINFNSPYKASSIIDFWRRWHISLSHFLKRYLYIPLGGNRHGKQRHYLNLFTTMLLGGCWHGAGFTFMIWGALHGLYLCINHAFRSLKLSLNNVLSWFITFIAVVVAWVFFRAPTVNKATDIIKSMFGFGDNTLSAPHIENAPILLSVILVSLIWLTSAPNTRQIAITRRPKYRYGFTASTVLYLSILNFSQISEFIYFQF